MLNGCSTAGVRWEPVEPYVQSSLYSTSFVSFQFAVSYPSLLAVPDTFRTWPSPGDFVLDLAWDPRPSGTALFSLSCLQTDTVWAHHELHYAIKQGVSQPKITSKLSSLAIAMAFDREVCSALLLRLLGHIFSHEDFDSTSLIVAAGGTGLGMIARASASVGADRPDDVTGAMPIPQIIISSIPADVFGFSAYTGHRSCHRGLTRTVTQDPSPRPSCSAELPSFFNHRGSVAPPA
jgi:hypothetical protein